MQVGFANQLDKALTPDMKDGTKHTATLRDGGQLVQLRFTDELKYLGRTFSRGGGSTMRGVPKAQQRQALPQPQW